MNYKINHANIKDWAKNYDGELFDGILCDPPYELGFMGKSWDSSGIAFDTEMWADIFKLLKPGGHLLAFSGSRTYHRMAVAIEDAGFEIRDMIEWVYGSGFPKSLNIGKAVDKIQGNEREVVGKIAQPGSTNKRLAMGNGWQDEPDLTKGTSEWEGYGTALKPAHEPCVLARKPLDGTVANNVLKHGTGGLNIDGTRVKTDEQLNYGTGKKSNVGFKTSPQNNDRPVYDGSGRFPANLIHDGSDEVVGLFPDSNGGAFPKKSNIPTGQHYDGGWGAVDNGKRTEMGSGSASRFFYTAKASKSERNAGLEGFDTKVNGAYDGNVDTTKARKIGANPERQNIPTANGHPTVKPLSLTKYLATLIKPPTGGRLLVPFSGSGSEMIGALQAGWEYVEGVELTEEYIPIAEARIKYWLDQMAQEDAKPKQVGLV